MNITRLIVSVCFLLTFFSISTYFCEDKIQQEAIWIRNREPVPSWVLYPYTPEIEKQAPPADAKPQSWHNRLLFPKKYCPYCGRRIPTETTNYFFLIIGFLGQGIFACRFLVQWIASERVKTSIIPSSFWWLSLVGSVLLLVYAIHIKAWPIIIGQVPGFFVYARNLHFLWLDKQINQNGNVSRET